MATLAGSLIKRSDVIEYETNNATGTVAAHHIRMFFTVLRFREFSSFSTISSLFLSPSISISSEPGKSISCILKVGPFASYIFMATARYVALTNDVLFASTIPNSDPTMQCVVDRGIPSRVPRMMQLAVAN